jgi:hypothetical protein
MGLQVLEKVEGGEGGRRVELHVSAYIMKWFSCRVAEGWSCM